MVNTPRAQAPLCDLEAAAFAQQNVGGGHTHVFKQHFGVAVRCVVVAKHVKRSHDLHPRSVGGNQNHALLRMARRLRIGLAHGDEHGAARVIGARSPPFATIDDVFVPLAFDAGFNVGGVARRDVWLGHGKGRSDLALQQGLEPARLVGIVAVAGDGFHVAGVGRRAIEDFARPQHTPHDFGQGCVLLVGQASALVARGFGRVHRQKQIPEPGGLRLGLELFNRLQRCPAFAGGRVGGQFSRVGGLGGIDVVIHELEQPGLQVLGFG